jgi:hypothetical protein
MTESVRRNRSGMSMENGRVVGRRLMVKRIGPLCTQLSIRGAENMGTRRYKLEMVGAVLALATANVATAGVIFQDTFTGDPMGGMRTLLTDNGTTNTISNTLPTIGGSDYLNSTVSGATGASSNRNIITYTPTNASSSWNALVGSNIVVGPNSFLNINGGFDIFVRPNVITAGSPAAWFRPVDVDNRTPGGARIIFNGLAAGRYAFTFASTLNNLDIAASAATPFAAFDTAAYNANSPVTAVTFANGNTYHLGFTLVTDQSSGLITYSLFGKQGTDAIDTTSATDRLFQAYFYANGDALSGSGTHAVLKDTGWTWYQSSIVTPFPDSNVDYDTYRIQNGVVTEFAAVPEPASLGLLGLSGLAMVRRRRDGRPE